jgi:hypothetical protein
MENGSRCQLTATRISVTHLTALSTCTASRVVIKSASIYYINLQIYKMLSRGGLISAVCLVEILAYGSPACPIKKETIVVMCVKSRKTLYLPVGTLQKHS